MRKIESLIIDAIKAKHNFKSGERDEIIHNENENKLVVKLWGHTIATIKYDSHTIQLSDCGYSTMPTMSRLNCVTAALSIPVTFRVKNYCTTVLVNGVQTKQKIFMTSGWVVYVA